MSSLSYKYKAMMEQLFEMETGYVLDFSNNTFRQFIVEKTDIDIYQDSDYISEPSKAKKLRLFVQKENDHVVGKVILDLLDIRDANIERKKEYDDEFIDKYAVSAKRLREEVMRIIGGAIPFPSNEARLKADIAIANLVLKDLISIGQKVCLNNTYSKTSSENCINDYFRDMLFALGYTEVKDQTRHGISQSGKDAGEVDLLLTKNGNEVAIIEALKLNYINTDYIKKHIDKSITNYNALGTATFIIIYTSSSDFGVFWNRFVDYIKAYKYPMQVKKTISEMPHPNAVIRVAETILSRDEYDFPVYFIVLNIENKY